MEFFNYEETLDYSPINEEIINTLWGQYKRHVVLYSGEHVLFNEYAKTIDLFMGEINKLKSNRISEGCIKGAIKQYKYLNEKFMQVETDNLTYELWLLCRDMLKTMVENSGYYELSIFNNNMEGE